MTKDPRVYLAHILECIQKIERFTTEGRSCFFQDVMVQDAVLRNFEVIGEATKRLDDALPDGAPGDPLVGVGRSAGCPHPPIRRCRSGAGLGHRGGGIT